MKKPPKPPRPETQSVRIEVVAFEALKAACEFQGKRVTWELSRAAERATKEILGRKA